MLWEVEFTDELGVWWDSLSAAEQASIDATVSLLEVNGPNLPFPHCSAIDASRHGHMRELRIQHAGRPYRILYAFDPMRYVILLIGGDKTGKQRWYQQLVPVADRLYDEHLLILKSESTGKER